MPRGVYDRSKSKAQRAAEKTAAAPVAEKTAAPAKKKYTKKSTLTPVGAVGAKEYQAPDVQTGIGYSGQSRKSELAGAIRLLSETRGALKDTHSIASNSIDNLLTRAVSEYEKQLFPVEQETVQQKVEIVVPAPVAANGAAAPAPAPVAAAPVPFNPPTFSPPAQS